MLLNPYNYNSMVPLTRIEGDCTSGTDTMKQICCGQATSLLAGCQDVGGGEYVPINDEDKGNASGCWRFYDGDCEMIGTLPCEPLQRLEECKADENTRCFPTENACKTHKINVLHPSPSPKPSSSPSPSPSPIFHDKGKSPSPPPSPKPCSELGMHCGLAPNRCHFDDKSKTCLDGGIYNFLYKPEIYIMLSLGILVIVILLILAIRHATK
jgi:hypothetical protein